MGMCIYPKVKLENDKKKDFYKWIIHIISITDSNLLVTINIIDSDLHINFPGTTYYRNYLIKT